LASFDECIDAVVSQGKISRQLADQIKQSPSPLDTINDMTTHVKRQRREAAIQALRVAQQWERINSHPDGKARGLMSTLVKDISGKSGYANIDMRKSYYEARYNSMIADFLSKYRSRMTLDPSKGFITYDDEALNNFVRAMYGEDIGNPEIMGLADQYRKMLELRRQDFNRLGGSISKNERYIMPQNHDAPTVRRYGKDEWLADIKNWIDSRYMTDDAGKVLSPEELNEGLQYAYESITTNGLNKAKDFTAPVGQSKKMARRGSDKRFIYFKDAESWIAYQNKYGRGDVFQTLVTDVTHFATDMASMEIFGTNPRTAFDALVQQIEKVDGPLKGSQKLLLKQTFKVATGNVEQGDLVSLADAMQGFRNIITATRLGRAFISSISDVGTQLITAKYNNMPYMKNLKRQIALIGTTEGAEEMRLFAAKIGLGAEGWVRAASSANRFGDVYNVGKTGKMAEVVMRASFLEQFTDGGRKAFTMEMSALLAENFGKAYSELDTKLKRGFASYGIDEADWDVFRATPPQDLRGVKYADMLQEGSDKFHQMVMTEVDYAVPTPDSRVSAMLGKGVTASSVSGQIFRTVGNLKTFPVTMLTHHLSRAYYQATAGEQIAYAGALLATTTMFGALAMMGKDINSGKEPRTPTDGREVEFWLAAMAQGGGLGILGDFLFADHNRFGNSFIASLPGPTGQITEDAIKLTIGNLQEAFRGEDTNWSTEAMRFIESNTPNIWQVQPIKNAMFDQLEYMVDPQGAQKKWSRARKKLIREQGTDYWWRPGEALPEALQ